MLYNVVFISAVQQSESAICIDIHLVPLGPPSQTHAIFYRIYFLYWFLISYWENRTGSMAVKMTLCSNFAHLFVTFESESHQLCPTLCNLKDCTVHGILQARILEWVAFPFSRGSSQPKDWTRVSRIAGGFFISWATREAQVKVLVSQSCDPIDCSLPVSSICGIFQARTLE